MWEPVPAALRREVRVRAGREPEPRAALLDPPSIPTRSVRGDARGSAGGKKIQGRKRHLRGDTLGFRILVNVLAADRRDREGGTGLLLPLAGNTPRLPVLWGETGSDGKPFQPWVKHQLAVRLEVVTHPWTGMRGVWAPEGAVSDGGKVRPQGFPVLPRRWVVERTTAWITHHRRLSRDVEGTHSRSEAFLSLALTTLMVSRLIRAVA